MKFFKNKVAVITGGASGLGRAMAYRFAEAGMRIVIADIEAKTIEETLDFFRMQSFEAVGEVCDVSQPGDVENLAQATMDHFGSVDILCNNAGVSASGRAWEHTKEEWEWAIGVNVWGVINGIRTFTPLMLDQNTEGHIINTASVAGLLSLPQMSLYCLTKHSVVTLTESLYHDLREVDSKLSCSVLCPAYVPTKISDSERNRPSHLKDKRIKTEENLRMEEKLKYAVEAGKISAKNVAELVFEAVLSDKFYILSHPRIKPTVETRLWDVLQDRQPTNTFNK